MGEISSALLYFRATDLMTGAPQCSAGKNGGNVVTGQVSLPKKRLTDAKGETICELVPLKKRKTAVITLASMLSKER